MRNRLLGHRGSDTLRADSGATSRSKLTLGRRSAVDMRRTVVTLTPILVGLWLGCGAAPSNSTNPNSKPPSNAEAEPAEEASSGPAPDEGEVRSALQVAAEDACSQACGHIASCAGAEVDAGCEEDCVDALVQGSGAPAQVYAGCVQELDCEAVKGSAGLNAGPLGACYVSALRMGR